jgi:hypothetical protein
MNCPHCNSKVSSADKFCRNCGKAIVIKDDHSEIIGYQCPLCETPNPKSVNYCVKCGHWLLDTTHEAKPITKKSFKKYFSNSKEGTTKSRKILNWILLILFVILYFSGTADTKMLLSFLVIILGFISIIKPLRLMGINTRLRGLAAVFIGIIILFISATYLPDSKTTTSTVDPNQYKSQSISIPYDDLARETEKYTNNKVMYNGQVVQVTEGQWNNIVLRVNVTKDESNIYKDTIWVNYKYTDGEKRILENDIINLWGEVKGRKSYKAVLGNEVVVPEIQGRIIENMWNIDKLYLKV